MSNATHTLGPWQAKGQYTTDTEETCAGMYAVMGRGDFVIGCFDRKEDRDLASAAPQLLEALQNIERWSFDTATEIAALPYAALRAAIAKATGAL